MSYNPFKVNIFKKVEELTEGASLKSHYQALSERYRTGVDKTLGSSKEHLAYLACRMPATYSVLERVYSRLKEMLPDFQPKSMLDVGSGPGTCLLALQEEYKLPDSVVMVDQDNTFIEYAKILLQDAAAELVWRQTMPEEGSFDLVTSSYMLSELDETVQQEMVQKMIARTAGCLVLVDTGTPSGYSTLMRARGALIEAGYQILAPCPHNRPCPLEGGDWCHFSERLARSRQHKQIKGAELGYEDEKYCYLVASKIFTRDRDYERILMPPAKRSGHAHVKLCLPDGTAVQTVISKKQKDRYQQIKKAEWGDRL